MHVYRTKSYPTHHLYGFCLTQCKTLIKTLDPFNNQQSISEALAHDYRCLLWKQYLLLKQCTQSYLYWCYLHSIQLLSLHYDNACNFLMHCKSCFGLPSAFAYYANARSPFFCLILLAYIRNNITCIRKIVLFSKTTFI